jgi:hypothetical protein
MSRGIYYKGADGNWHSVVMPYIRTDIPIPTTLDLSVTVQGAGGGTGGNDSHGGYPGSAGHQLTGTLTIPFGKNIQVYVGGPGAGGTSGSGNGGGGGGGNALGYNGGPGGSTGGEGWSGSGGGGGAATVISIDGTVTVVAAGGGGGGGGGNNSNGQPSEGYASSGAIAGSAGGNKTSGGEHGGGGGSVICTKLFELGKLPQDVYDADEAYGQMIVAKYPYVYHGYRAWSGIVVDWMSGTGPQMMFWISDDAERALAQTTWSRRWAEEIAIPWAEEMAYRMGKRDVGNNTGLAIMCLGVPISAVIGLWQQAFGKSNKPAGRIKGSLLIVAFTLLRGIVAVGDLFKGKFNAK